jgi:hypothetical protein
MLFNLESALALADMSYEEVEVEITRRVQRDYVSPVEKAFAQASGSQELLDTMTTDFDLREHFVKNFAWAAPCKEAIDAIKKFARPPIYDPMAGLGFWAKLLNDRGVETLAFDHLAPGENHYRQVHHARRTGRCEIRPDTWRYLARVAAVQCPDR